MPVFTAIPAMPAFTVIPADHGVQGDPRRCRCIRRVTGTSNTLTSKSLAAYFGVSSFDCALLAAARNSFRGRHGFDGNVRG